MTPAVNQTRYTASAQYVLPLRGEASWSSMIAWGRQQLSGGVSLNAFLAETEYKPDTAWTIFARAESVQNDELFTSGGSHTIGEVTLGAIHDWHVTEHAAFGLGGEYTFDAVPSSPAPAYGSNPHGAMAFVRLNLE